jgi:ribose 1,5-bisphosphokinase PhnN
MFNGSRQALGFAMSVFPDLRIIVVTAPDHILADRLSARGRETRADIENRLKRATFELPERIDATVVLNDSTEAEGISRFLAAIADLK